ncbi:hypothetical protein TorRG33x02_138760 [Trema orientale]|uniref:Uncharacterized protein n=1 Tax=Trema orientale TaxID=63057 RepID=A0A2P5EXG5_TREOI|nr:hypothetical protein TorRG33x02_138760 [Trema orientale]
MKFDSKALGGVSIERLMIGFKRKLSMDGLEDSNEGKRRRASHGKAGDRYSSILSASLVIQGSREL